MKKNQPERLVMITKCSHERAWYKNFIGHIFNIRPDIHSFKDGGPGNYLVSVYHAGKALLQSDYEMVTINRRPNETYAALAIRWNKFKEWRAGEERKHTITEQQRRHNLIMALQAKVNAAVGMLHNASNLHELFAAHQRVVIAKAELASAIQQPTPKYKPGGVHDGPIAWIDMSNGAEAIGELGKKYPMPFPPNFTLDSERVKELLKTAIDQSNKNDQQPKENPVKTELDGLVEVYFEGKLMHKVKLNKDAFVTWPVNMNIKINKV